ncbi:hypothetical protein B4923_16005 [Brenneria roseae subsp. americana]|uniref:Uncharacterized protein n=1 Tax=Brenneria roseae subsp. americana TaxID=1508507 RepID=A0A2U1TMH2_9GAMM|nr:hypothetical protein [Brenneria roseae]PWC10624.1 hypothetical protein B4923_16005 [Brenneria roseae subsp. americana]
MEIREQDFYDFLKDEQLLELRERLKIADDSGSIFSIRLFWSADYFIDDGGKAVMTQAFPRDNPIVAQSQWPLDKWRTLLHKTDWTRLTSAMLDHFPRRTLSLIIVRLKLEIHLAFNI